jgi:type I restriction enzyme M protein
MFYKRLCDQWENEAEEVIGAMEAQQGYWFTEKQKAVFRARDEHRFSILLQLATYHGPRFCFAIPYYP